MLKYLHIVLLVLATNVSFAQLRVTVLDKESGSPIPLAYVNVYKEPEHTITDASNQTDDFGLVILKPETFPCSIQVSAMGYESYTQQFIAQPVNNNISINLIKTYSSLNEVVITGTNKPQHLKNALSLYQVIPKSAIEAQGAVTLDEVLKKQLNITVSEDNVLGANAGMQGMGGNKLKILIDGMPINGRENGNINLNQINLNNTEKIEIIQGPMSVIYGSDAIAGVINIITKKNIRPLSIQANTYYESIGKYNVDASLGFSVKTKHQFIIGGGRNFFSGYKYIDTIWQSLNVVNKDIHRAQLYKPNEQYFGNGSYRYTAASGFNLNYAIDYLHETVIDKGPIHTWDQFDCYGFDSYYYTTRVMNRLSLNGKLGKTGTWQSQNSFMIYDHLRKQVKTDLVDLSKLLTTGQGDQDTSKFYDITSRNTYSNTFHKLEYTIGIDANLEYAHSTKIATGRKDIEDYAVFVNFSFPFIADKLVLQAGGRGSYNTSYRPPFTPNINLLFTPLKNLQIRASYSNGFRAPSLKEMYLSFIDANHHIIGNPNLKAEYSRTVQLSASCQVYQGKTNYMQIILTQYYNIVNNGIVLVNTRPLDTNSIDYMYGNMSAMKNTISNIQLDGQVGDFHYQFGYSYKFVFSETGQYTAFDASEVNTSLQYHWEKPGLNFSIFYKYTGPQPYVATAITGEPVYMGKQFAFHICDASVEHKFLKNRLQIIAGVKNIFNVTQPQTIGVVSTGPHGTGAAGSFLPRSFFTSLRLSID